MPDDGVMDGLSGVPVPKNRRLTLIRDADRRDVRGVGTDLLHRFHRDAELCRPDLVGVMFHPAGFGKYL